MPRTKKSSKTRHTPFTSQRGFMLGLGKPTTDFKRSTCKFCLSFGYEDHPGNLPMDPTAKKLKSNIKMAPYQVTNHSSSQVKRHMQRYHPQKFAEYQALVREINADPLRSRAEAEYFFSQTLMDAFVTPGEEKALRLFFDVNVVRLSKELFEKDPEFEGVQSLPKLTPVYDKPLEVNSDEESEDDCEQMDASANSSTIVGYMHYVKRLSAFTYVSDLVAGSCSFRQIAAVVSTTRSTFSAARADLPPVTRAEAATIVRLNALIGLQSISEILDSVHAFSLAADASSLIHAKSYFAIRIRVPPRNHEEGISNLHIIAAPMTSRHTGLHMYNLTVQVLDRLVKDWRLKLIGVTSDGAANMTGSQAGWQSRLQVSSTGKTFYRIWCGAHQLDLIDKGAISALKEIGSEWHAKLHQLIGILRKQYSLIEEMGTKSPYDINVRWSSLGAVVTWYKRHRDRLQTYLADNENETMAAFGEDTVWWLQTLVLEAHFTAVCKAMQFVQGKTALIAEQNERIDELYAEIVELYGILKDPSFQPCGPAVCGRAPGRVTFSAVGAHLGEHSMMYVTLLAHVKSISLDVRSLVNELEQDDQRGEGPEELRSVIKEIAVVALTTVEGLRLLSVSRTSSNGPSQRLPSVLPLDVAKIPPPEFIDIVADHADRFRSLYGSEAVDSISAEHRELRRAVEHGNEPELQRRLTDAAKETRGFLELWKPVGRRFENLRLLLGGIATVFPGSSTVESDFSIINYEKDSFRSRLADLSVEGTLHAKQRQEVLRLKAYSHGK
jgi:hypothetical protein